MSTPHRRKLLRLIGPSRSSRRILGADLEQDPDTLRCRALGIVDSLVIVADSAPNHMNVRCVKLTEDGILVGDAGAHWIDHVDADNYILRAHEAK